MTLLDDISVSKWFGAFLLVAAAELAIAPSNAQASCGDYVLLGEHAAHSRKMAFENDRIRRHSSAADFAIDSDPTDPDWAHGTPFQRGRCSGPNCSNDSPRPPDEPAPPVENDVRHLALTAGEWLPTTVVRQVGQFADDSALPQIATGSVFRPPR